MTTDTDVTDVDVTDADVSDADVTAAVDAAYSGATSHPHNAQAAPVEHL